MSNRNCCGQKRQEWQHWKTAKYQPKVPPQPVLQNPVQLHHVGSSSLVVKGEITGHVYLFANGEEGLSVDERDLPTLLATGQFVFRRNRDAEGSPL